MAIADAHGLLQSPVCIASASPHEVTLVEQTVDSTFLKHAPDKLIGDRAYDSDPLDERLLEQRGVGNGISPHRSSRRRPPTQDGRPLRRYRKRWQIEPGCSHGSKTFAAWSLGMARYNAFNFLGLCSTWMLLISSLDTFETASTVPYVEHSILCYRASTTLIAAEMRRYWASHWPIPSSAPRLPPTARPPGTLSRQ